MSYKEVIVEGSGKHCHLTRETVDTLFGKAFELEVKNWLSQPGEFLSKQKITVVGPKGQTVLSVIGPFRKTDQVELSLTDARLLGIEGVIRESGYAKGSPGCTLIGPKGEVALAEGVIIAKRHLHLTPEEASEMGVKNQQIVKIKVGGERALTFDEVVVRISPNYAMFAHIDYDEFNAAAMKGNTVGEIII